MELCASPTVIHFSLENEQQAIRATLQKYEVAVAARTEILLPTLDHGSTSLHSLPLVKKLAEMAK